MATTYLTSKMARYGEYSTRSSARRRSRRAAPRGRAGRGVHQPGFEPRIGGQRRSRRVHTVTVQAYRVAALSGLPAYPIWSASELSTFRSHTTAPSVLDTDLVGGLRHAALTGCRLHLPAETRLLHIDPSGVPR